MATPGNLTIGDGINSTSNTNNSSTTKTKGENGFCIIASMLNPATGSFIQDYQVVSFDSVNKTNVKRQADVTSYAVESGSEVSDHIQIKNNRFSLSGVISETPIRRVKDQIYSAGVNGTRISQAITWLDAIFDARQPFILVTEHRTFENVVLTGISYDYQSEEAIIFDLEFEQIRLASYGTVNTVALKTQSPKNVGGSVKQKVVVNSGKKTEADTVTTAFDK